MFDDLKAHITDWEDEAALTDYLQGLLDKKGFDHSGLIYGMGHAVYTLSDPRARILKDYAQRLSVEKGREKEFHLYESVEHIAGHLLAKKRNTYKPLSANVDFYSGFVYSMLDIPIELFTPIFAIARISGWCAHRIEELVNSGKIIRPAYKYVGTHRKYKDMDERDW
jgi:citrate synthase